MVKQDETGALAAYYTHFVIKNQRDYTHLKLIDLSLETYIENIPKMHNYQILFSLRHIYKYQS